VASVTFDKVTKQYRSLDEPALRGLSLEIADHEFFVLLGPSGCGKSTLLKILSGLEEPESGHILLGERLVNFMPPGRRDVAMVFQNYALYPQMTVAENVEFPLRMRGVKKAKRTQMALDVATSLGLEGLLRRRASELSGGQRQRVAVARALVRDPQVLLMDEPLSNLDALLRAGTREELVRIHRNAPKTIIYVTHDQVEATTMAHRIAVMRLGRVEQVGTPAEIYERPANTFVAGFVGSPPMNLLAGGLSHDAGSVAFSGQNLHVAIDLPPGAVLPESIGTMGVRPEAIRIVPTEEGLASGVVRLRESLGPEHVLLVECGEYSLRVRVAHQHPAREGDAVGLVWGQEDLHLFDASAKRVAIDSAGDRSDSRA
jgi:multiple sugar transport system ATP-binding protein